MGPNSFPLHPGSVILTMQVFAVFVNTDITFLLIVFQAVYHNTDLSDIDLSTVKILNTDEGGLFCPQNALNVFCYESI